MTYVPDPGDVDLVAQVLAVGRWDVIAPLDKQVFRIGATTILRRLAAAGRLLPTGGKVREESGYRLPAGGITNATVARVDATHLRTVITWPVEGIRDDHWARYVGPWVAVDEGSRTA